MWCLFKVSLSSYRFAIYFLGLRAQEPRSISRASMLIFPGSWPLRSRTPSQKYENNILIRWLETPWIPLVSTNVPDSIGAIEPF